MSQAVGCLPHSRTVGFSSCAQERTFDSEGMLAGSYPLLFRETVHRGTAVALPLLVFNRPCFTEREYGRYRQKVGLCYLNVCELSQEMETEWPCTSARLVTREGCLLGPLVARRPGCARRIGASCLSSIHSGIVLSFPKVVWSFDGRS